MKIGDNTYGKFKKQKRNISNSISNDNNNDNFSCNNILSLNSSGITSKANEVKTKSDKATVEEYVAALKAESEL